VPARPDATRVLPGINLAVDPAQTPRK